jgi:hypothetical protein
MWLDPHPNGRVLPRISVQTHPVDELSLPRGERETRGFHIREADIPASDWDKMFQGQYTPEEQQIKHAQWWDGAAGEYDPPGSFELLHDYQLAASGEPEQPVWRETIRKDAFKKIGRRWLT